MSSLKNLFQNSPEARIFCLVHKMDLVSEEQRDEIFREREEDLKRLSKPLECTCFRTSIWDETLYKWVDRVICLFHSSCILVGNHYTVMLNHIILKKQSQLHIYSNVNGKLINYVWVGSYYQFVCTQMKQLHRFNIILKYVTFYILLCSINIIL